MSCPQPEPLSDSEFLRRLNQRATAQRVPLAGSLALTSRCNLRCAHCYASPAQRGDGPTRELDTAAWLSVLDQVADAGCLELLLTGGEPLLRPDFPAIYRHARRRGLLVTLFTNGTLVSDEAVALFTDLPLRQIEITLYGATAETYERVTGVRGSFERCLAGLRRLLEAHLPVSLKTVLMTLNAHELPALRRLAQAHGVKFRLDPALFPRLDGDPTPLQWRVPAHEAVALEMADELTRRTSQELFRQQNALPPRATLYQCAAGVTTFHVDAGGALRPCLMVADPSVDLRAQSFRSAWESAIPALHERMPPPAFACSGCDKRALCGYCPAFFALENGTEGAPSAYLCALGQLRYAAILPTMGDKNPVQREGVHDGLCNPTNEEIGLREAPAASH